VKKADLVLEGGGVKGIGLVGAVSVLQQAGYEFPRVAGTSAGAIVAAMLAAGAGREQMIEAMHEMDYASFMDGGAMAHMGLLGRSLLAVFEEGIYRGDRLHRWIEEHLASLGVRTWKDLRLDEPRLPPEQRYRLVVIVSDVSRGKMLRLPWDYKALCGLDPDEQSVALAVRASASLPFFFEPIRLRCGKEHSRAELTLVDGGLLSNFPVDIFDGPEDSWKQWPTFGIKLSTKPDFRHESWREIENSLDMALAILAAMAVAHDQVHVDQPSVQQRTIFVDTAHVRSTDMDLDEATRDALFENGVHAAERFLHAWSQGAEGLRSSSPTGRSGT
jgi:NTE family protein